MVVRFRHPNISISYVLPTKRWSRRVAVYFTAHAASKVCARAAFAKIVDDGRKQMRLVSGYFGEPTT
jgi:hypothetical protein